jgi:hypothetical protein
VSPFVAKTLRLSGLVDERGIHVSTCERPDPYPTGRAFDGDRGSLDRAVRLADPRAT